KQLDSLGFLNIAEQDPSIIVSLMYARADNFTGEVLYTDLKEAYLHPDAMQCLLKAQQLLKAGHPELTLAVFDAARPMSVQQKMWNTVKGTAKQNYVSNPARGGGMHNYGVAVDITLATADGDTLPMGTKIDHLGKEANISQEASLVRQGKMSAEAWENRKLLREVMTKAGFKTLPSEWWHFNLVSRNEARQRYKVIP
ncbi:MAG: M15 family metallopeptidase, partial [Bacteroidaceae bacterium]|nr:M15 family metallopeptidase [Bacteroidaceae bacterium]